MTVPMTEDTNAAEAALAALKSADGPPYWEAHRTGNRLRVLTGYDPNHKLAIRQICGRHRVELILMDVLLAGCLEGPPNLRDLEAMDIRHFCGVLLEATQPYPSGAIHEPRALIRPSYWLTFNPVPPPASPQVHVGIFSDGSAAENEMVARIAHHLAQRIGPRRSPGQFGLYHGCTDILVEPQHSQKEILARMTASVGTTTV